jgi:hypothetical protein
LPTGWYARTKALKEALRMGPDIEKLFHDIADLSAEARTRYFDEPSVDP